LSYVDILYENNPHPTKTKHPKIMEAAEIVNTMRSKKLIKIRMQKELE
jgi:ribonuclease BN (tRNA processing enzyme)